LRRIASTSVGRVLLYRILIEIRRHNPGGNVGVLDNTVPVHANVFFRNACRSIFIQWNNRAEFTFDAGNRWICIINTGTTLPSLGKEGVDPPRSYDNVILCKLPVDVSMFHEMNHWYHYLRYPDRYYNEKNYYQIGLHIDGTNMPVNLGLPLPVGAPPVAAILGRYYWGILGGWGNMVGSERLWYYSARNAAATESRPDFEEMRNILGIKNIGLPVGLVFYNGDDLSENLYRMSVGQPLRFGYVLAEYYEDSRVIDVIISICNFWKEHYNFSPRRMKRANFEYTNASNQQGMGSCKTFQ
jgi:hypothetical protein